MLRTPRPDDEIGNNTPSTSTPPPPAKPDTWLQRHAVTLAAIALAILTLVVFAHGIRPQ